MTQNRQKDPIFFNACVHTKDKINLSWPELPVSFLTQKN